MIHRQGKFGNFWGCANFPKCKGISKATNGGQYRRQEVARPASLDVRAFTPSDEQVEVGKVFVKQVKALAAKKQAISLIVPSVPGSGKTYTLTYLGALLAPYVDKNKISACFACFNTNIRSTLEGKIPAEIGDVLSVNQIGNRACTKSFGSKFNENKLNDLIRAFNNEQSDEDKLMRGWWGGLKKCVEMLKVNMLAPNQENIEYCLARYNVDVPASAEFVGLVQQIFAQSLNTQTVDYTDQYFLPAHYAAVQFARKYHIILGDEVQDWSKAQIECVRKSLLPGGFFVLVGDPNQAIYSWRGADPDAMPRMKEELGATELKLTVCRRCPKGNVALASRLVSHISPLENAPFGNFHDFDDEKTIELLKRRMGTRCLLLARKNVHLAKWCLKLLRSGVKAIIRGKDVATGLLLHIERHQDSCKSLGELLEKIESWRVIEGEKLRAMGERAVSRLENLNDQVETLNVLSEGMTSIVALIKRIEDLFSDIESGNIVHCSTIYRAKGDEAPIVVIAGPEDFDKVWGNDEVASIERRNIGFVLVTRTVFSEHDHGTTIFVNGRPKDFEIDC
jgi:ssDNA-binding Zn-finger/Zn-ribbon topoisomerase 1